MGNPHGIMLVFQFFRLIRVVAAVIDPLPQIIEPPRAGHQLPDLLRLGELMGKTGVPAVVEQAAQPDGFEQIINGIKLAYTEIRTFAQLAFAQIGVDHGAEHAGTHMHHTDTVQKAGMGSTGKHQIENVVLADVPQALEQRVVNNLDFVAVERNSPVDRVHDQLVIGSEQVVDGTSHSYNSPKMMTANLLYHIAMPE